MVSNCLAAQYCVDSGTQNTRANLAYGQRLCVVRFILKTQKTPKNSFLIKSETEKSAPFLN